MCPSADRPDPRYPCNASVDRWIAVDVERNLMKSGRWVAIAVLCTALAGCSKEIPVVDKDTLERQLFERLATEWGHNPQEVKCPAGLRGEVGHKQACVVTDDGVDYNVFATVNAVSGDSVSFTIETGDALTKETPVPEVYIGREDLARGVAERMAQQLGREPQLVNCPNDLPAVLDATVMCYFHDRGDVYDATVKVTQVDGNAVLYDVLVAPPR
jgi:hypothetical protein